MASNHGTAVIKNLCYTAPRHPRTNKPATENERARSSLEAEPLENDGLSDFSERKLPSSRRHKKHHQGHKTKVSVRESLSHSLRELDGVDEENFYEHLLALKNEHKKSLKALEKLYYSEKDKRDHGFELDSKTKIAVRDFDDSRVQEHFPLRDSSFEELQASRRRSFSDPLDGEYWEDEDRDATRSRSEDHKVLYKEMYPQRSSALDVVENMWEDFSVYDYPPEASPPREKHAKKKEWTPQITIPKPFTMTMREAKKKAKNMTRSQMILQEDLKKKKEKEEAELHKKFRAQPVPATTFLPLYDEITRQNELRRYHVQELSKAILKSTEKPFKFTKREEEKKQMRRTKSLSNLAELENKIDEKKKFKANPFPDHLFDLTLADRIAEKEEYRAIRIRMRAQETLAVSRLPPNMEARGEEYTLGHFRSKLNKEGNKNAFMTKDHKFRPQINPDVPEFDALHRQFEKEMRNKKKELEPTVVEPFNLRTARLSTTRKARSSRSQEVPDTGRSSRDRSASRERPSSARSSTPHDTLPFGITESARLRESTIRRSLENRRANEQEEIKQVQQRQRRQKILKPEVTRKVMANDHSAQLKKAAKEKVQSFREGDRARREEYNQELKEMQDRVNKRPLLFEQQSQATARRAAERKYADILRSAGVEEALVRDLVTKDGKIVDVDSDDELEETGSQVNYSGSRRSSGAGYTRDSHDGNVDEDTSDVEEEIEEEEDEI
ncbi:hypothetical protein pdam_00013455 [Pocillopora damicornis]|uniref:FAM161 centrosomal protein A n=1 Tax=Pocillopora damicornis TaxID=46731 RepID=A0A3M6TES9_POCDA|nr:hypothetical protein pdam_00013455 [Pocillopora damicornis]